MRLECIKYGSDGCQELSGTDLSMSRSEKSGHWAKFLSNPRKISRSHPDRGPLGLLRASGGFAARRLSRGRHGLGPHAIDFIVESGEPGVITQEGLFACKRSVGPGEVGKRFSVVGGPS